MENTKNQEALTAEEMHQKKEEMINFYKESMPYLQAQHEYEEMLCKIDEVRFKRANIQYQFAMMNAGPEEEETDKIDTLKEELKSEAPLQKNPKGKKLKTK